MNISRKEFFRKSLLSLGEAVFTVKDALQAPAGPPLENRVVDYPADSQEDQLAVAYNEHCLARSCGCFSCVEQCGAAAIKLVAGVGIRINPQLCTGCGNCENVCPVTPKAVRMQARTRKHTPSADYPLDSPVKGELPC